MKAILVHSRLVCGNQRGVLVGLVGLYNWWRPKLQKLIIWFYSIVYCVVLCYLQGGDLPGQIYNVVPHCHSNPHISRLDIYPV